MVVRLSVLRTGRLYPQKIHLYRGFQEIKVPRFHDNGTGWW